MPTLVDFTVQEVQNKTLDTTLNAVKVTLAAQQSGSIQTVKIDQTTTSNDVDVISVVPGTAATNLGKAVDAVAGATDTGIAPVAIRDDVLSTLTPVEGDYVPLRVDANGALWVSVEGVDIQIGAVEIKNATDDTRVKVLAASTAAVATDTSMVVALHPSSPVPAGTNAIGKLAANSGVDIGDVDILSIAAGDNNIGNVDIVTLPALVTGSATIGAVTGTTADNAANPTLKLGILPAVALAAAPTRTEGNVNPLRVTLAGDAVITLDGEAVVLGAGTAEIGKLAAGTANIGDVDVLTIAAGDNNIGNVDVVTLPALVAGTANIGDVDVLTVPAPLNVTGTGLEATALRVTLASDSTGLVSVDDNGGNLSIDWAGTVPPIGAGTEAAALRVTVATDSTGVLSVDDNSGSLTVDGTITANAGTNLNTSALALEATLGSVKTAVELIDNMIAGSEAQVDVVAALPAGTNVIGGVTGGGIYVAATSTAVAADTIDATGLSAVANTRLVGYSIAENAATAAAAEVILRHGTSATDPILFEITLAANESIRDWFGPDGIAVANGVFVDRVSGRTGLTLFSKVVA